MQRFSKNTKHHLQAGLHIDPTSVHSVFMFVFLKSLCNLGPKMLGVMRFSVTISFEKRPIGHMVSK